MTKRCHLATNQNQTCRFGRSTRAYLVVESGHSIYCQAKIAQEWLLHGCPLSKRNQTYDFSLMLWWGIKLQTRFVCTFVESPMSYFGYNIEVSTPSAIEQTFKNDLQHMADIGILEGYRAYGWAFPCFIVTKKKTAESDKSMTSYLSTNVSNTKKQCLLFIYFSKSLWIQVLYKI